MEPSSRARERSGRNRTTATAELGGYAGSFPGKEDWCAPQRRQRAASESSRSLLALKRAGGIFCLSCVRAPLPLRGCDGPGAVLSFGGSLAWWRARVSAQEAGASWCKLVLSGLEDYGDSDYKPGCNSLRRRVKRTCLRVTKVDDRVPGPQTARGPV